MKSEVFLSRLSGNRSRIIVGVFFILFLGLGIGIFKDYGISYDEYHSRQMGLLSVKLITTGDTALYKERSMVSHGTAFEIFLIGLEKIFGLKDLRAIYLMRHLVTFLIFYVGVIFFYLLCLERFKNWKMGLLGCLFLILSPRIFADSFYNSKDIPFLSFFVIGIYTLVKFLQKKDFFWAILHALASALAVDIRILGVMIPFLTVLGSGTDLWRVRVVQTEGVKLVTSFLLYAVFLIGFTILFWPILWKNPLQNFVGSFIHMSRYHWPGDLRYFGDYIKARNVPWHYIPVWFGISTPLPYLFGFLVGLFAILRNGIKHPFPIDLSQRSDFIFMAWFFLPIAAVIVCGSEVYDGWRHLFFIYPAFILISLAGFAFLYRWVRERGGILSFNIIGVALFFIIAWGLVDTAGFMVRYHPWQNVYFNVLAGNMQQAKKNFELDYWGLSYGKALEYILKSNPEGEIRIFTATDAGRYNTFLLRPQDRDRLIFVKNPKEAEYLMSNYRGDNYREDKLEKLYSNEVFSVKVNGTKIMVVYRLS